MTKSIFGIVRTQNHALSIIDRLKVAGFSEDDISVLCPDRRGISELGHEKHSKAPEGAVAGAGTGGVVGGALGLLAGIGTLAIPGIGPLIAAGPILATLSGAAVGAAAGGLTGALIGMGIPEYEAKRYEGQILAGNVLISVSVHDQDQARTARRIMDESGAEDLGTTSQSKASDAPGEVVVNRPIGSRIP